MRPIRARRPDQHGVSSVIGAILITAIVFSMVVTVRVSFVPVWEKNSEGVYLVGAEKQLAVIKAEHDRQLDNSSAATVVNPITLAQERVGIFSSGGPSQHAIEFNASGHATTLQSNKILILSNNGTSIAGLNPEWIPIGGAETIVDVGALQNLRIRITPMTIDFAQENQSVNLTVTDVNGDLLGWFSVTGYLQPSEYVITYATYQAPAIRIAEFYEGLHRQTEFPNYYIDVLDSVLLFDDILASGDGPYRLELTHTPEIDAEYTIAYAEQTAGGSVLVGSAGVTRSPYLATYNSGSLVFHGQTSHHVDQTFVLENGALIVEQTDGAAFKIQPSLFVSTTSGIVHVQLTIPSLAGEASFLSGVSNAKIRSEVLSRSVISAMVPRLEYTVSTHYPELWQTFFIETLDDAGLSSAGASGSRQYETSRTSNTATFIVYGLNTAVLSEAYDMSLSITQGRILLSVEG